MRDGVERWHYRFNVGFQSLGSFVKVIILNTVVFSVKTRCCFMLLFVIITLVLVAIVVVVVDFVVAVVFFCYAVTYSGYSGYPILLTSCINT